MAKSYCNLPTTHAKAEALTKIAVELGEWEFNHYIEKYCTKLSNTHAKGKALTKSVVDLVKFLNFFLH